MGTQLERGVRYHGRASDPTDRKWYAPGRETLGEVGTGTPGRDPALWPGPSDSIWNIGIGSGAVFESAASGTATYQIQHIGAAINAINYSVSYNVATDAAPITRVTCENSTLVWNIQIPEGAQTTLGTDGWTTFVQSDRFTAFDGYGMKKLANGTWSTRYDLIQYDLRQDGLSAGRRAGNVGLAYGLLRSNEMRDGYIGHMVAGSAPASALKRLPTSVDGDGIRVNSGGAGNGSIWPANGADSPTNFIYSGLAPMGSVWGIPPTVGLASLGLSSAGMILGRALQDKGMGIFAQSGTIGLVAEPACYNDTSIRPIYQAMVADWKNILIHQIRRIMNSRSGDDFLPGTRTPTSNAQVLGPGTRRGTPAPDFTL